MLPETHADFMAYRKDPKNFVVKLYRDIKAEWASLYSDDMLAAEKCLGYLDKALHEGFSRRQILDKVAEAKSLSTTAQYRSTTVKFIEDGFWRKQYHDSVEIVQAQVSRPWTGPMPNRF